MAAMVQANLGQPTPKFLKEDAPPGLDESVS